MDKLKNNQIPILVFGDLMIDEYLWGEVNRISPEAPVPIVNVHSQNIVLGGAGNVLNNLLALEAKPYIISAIGDDSNANILLELLQKKGISTDSIIQERSRKTAKKTRIIATNQQMIRFDEESTFTISKQTSEKIAEILRTQIPKSKALLISDYNKGLLTDELLQLAIQEAKKHNIFVLVDPKGDNYTKYSGASFLTPNKKEAQTATGIDIIDDTSLQMALEKLKNDYALDLSLITLSEDGIAFFDTHMHKMPAHAREVFDVTGAGDTVLATLGLMSAYGYKIGEAVRIANIAAAVVVGKVGSAVASLQEISFFFKNHLRIVSFEDLDLLLEQLRLQKNQIVFTNGCFDILHAGHLEYLQKSRSLGDCLIVGLNSDKSVRFLKGDSRPINTQIDRANLLASLRYVDFVVIFDESTPEKLIEKIAPDILTKGADYKDKEIIGAKFASKVKLINFVDGYSSTNMIKKIKEQT